MVSTVGGALLAGWVLAALELWILGAHGAAGTPTEPVRPLITTVVSDFSQLALAAAGAVALLAALFRRRDGPLHPRRWLLAALVTLPAVWLGRELAGGAGVQRHGLDGAVRLGVPAIAFAVAMVAAWAAARWLAQGRLRSVAALVLAAAAARQASRVLYVGLYDPIHDLLFGVELVALAAGLRLMLGARESDRPSGWGVVASALVVAVAVPWLPLPLRLDEAVRARFGRDGFHERRFLRWRAARAGDGRSLAGPGDAALGEMLDAWAARASAAEAALGARLPRRGSLNLVWISVDTLRPDRLGCLGGPGGLTPAIDSLAAESALFTRCWAQYPSTHLSSESMFTGRYPRATALYRGIEGTADPGDAESVPLAGLLKRNGFATAAAIAFTEEWMQSPGFRRALASFDLLNFERPGAPSLAGEHFAASAIAALDELRGRRFFLWLHLFDPHHPYEHHDGLTAGEGTEARYDGEVRYADRQVGRVLEHLKRIGRWDDTVIVFNSDHGEALGERGVHYHGSSLYDEQLRVPLMIHVPGLPARRLDVNAENVDIYSTVTTLLDLKTRVPSQGTDLAPLLLDPDAHRGSFPNVAYAELPDDVEELSAGSANLVMLVRGDRKAIHHLDAAFTELYDLAADPGETDDLAARDPDGKEAMRSALVTLYRRTGAFGRSGDAAARHRGRVQELRRLLGDADPFRRLEAVVGLGELPEPALEEELRRLIESQDEFPEIRLQALRLAGRWGLEGLGDVWASWASHENPVLRWEAIRAAPAGVTIGDEASVPPLLADELALRDPARDRAAAARRIAAQARVPAGVRKRAVAACLREVGSAPAMPVDRLALPWSSAEVEAGLEALRARVAKAPSSVWLDEALLLVRNRYLAPGPKRAILGSLLDLGGEFAELLAMHLLAGWDPSFHEEAKSTLEPRLGAKTIRRLAAAKAAETDATDLAASGRFLPAVAALDEAAGQLTSAAARLPLKLRAARALLAAGRFQPAQVLADELRRGVDELRARHTVVPAMLSGGVRELASFSPALGPLPPETPIAVTRVAVDQASRRRVAAGMHVLLDVTIDHRGDRALPACDGDMGGRLRVLWSQVGGGEVIYGTETALRRGIMPSSSSEIPFTVAAPAVPGDWTGRVIVHQQGGSRFHVAETDASTFRLTVVAADGLPARSTWSAAELAAGFTADPLIESFGEWDGRVHGVATGYQGRITSPQLRFDGRPARLSVELRWWSSLPGAEAMTVDLLPESGGEAPPPVSVPIPRDGRPHEAAVSLPSVTGRYRVRLQIGVRQGVMELGRLSID